MVKSLGQSHIGRGRFQDVYLRCELGVPISGRARNQTQTLGTLEFLTIDTFWRDFTVPISTTLWFF